MSDWLVGVPVVSSAYGSVISVDGDDLPSGCASGCPWSEVSSGVGGTGWAHCVCRALDGTD